MSRVIIHLDMDAFFASVEQLDFPELRGKPVIVGASPDGRGVVSTCSYEARKFGIHSAMPISEAYRRCPQGKFVRGRMERYSEVSQQVFDIMAHYSPEIERVSIDEAFLDVTHSQGLFGPGPNIAREIQRRIAEELSLPASVGVAPNKFLAKVASDLKKPKGFVVVDELRVIEFLAPLPIKCIWGVGKKTAESLHKLNLKTIGDIQRTPPSRLSSTLGSYGQKIWELAHGIDLRSVEEEDEVKSVGHEHTFEHDTADIEVLKSTLLHLASKVGRRLRRKSLKGKTITLKLRLMDFSTFTRQCPLPEATDYDHHIYQAGGRLLDKLFRGQPVRLIGITASNLVAPGEAVQQLDLFKVNDEKTLAVTRALDQIKNRHGESSITYAKTKEFEQN